MGQLLLNKINFFVYLFQPNNLENLLQPSEPLSQRRQNEQDKIDELEMSQICWDTDPFAELSGEDSEPEAAAVGHHPKPGPSKIRHQDELDAKDNLEMTQVCWGAQPLDEVSSDEGKKEEALGGEHQQISSEKAMNHQISDESMIAPTPEKSKHPSSNVFKSVVRHRDELDKQDELEMTKIYWDEDEKSSDKSETETAADTHEVCSADVNEDLSSETDSGQLWDGEKSFWKNLNLDDFDEK